MSNHEDLYYKAIINWNESHIPSYHIHPEGGFIHFNINDALTFDKEYPPTSPLLKREVEDTGYKFHVSLHSDNIYEGWNVIFPILATYGIKHFKVAPNGFDEENKLQRGKEITVYAFKNSEIKKETWAQILDEITSKLILHKITPGPFANNPERKDERIPGSEYISYRNDNWRVKIQEDPNNIFKGLDLSKTSKQAKESVTQQDTSNKELSTEFLLQSQGFFSKRKALGLAASTLIAVVGLHLIKGLKK